MKFKLLTLALHSLALCFLLASSGGAFGQSDTIERVGGGRPVRGQIARISPTAVVVESGGTTQTIKVQDVRKINFGGINGTIRQAISQYYAGSYKDCLDSIERNKEKPTKKYIVAELAYCKAMSMAGEAMSGGNVTLKAAKSELNTFITTHGDSYRYYPASFAFSQLCVALGDFDVAKAGFNKVLESDWPTMLLKSRIQLGMVAFIEKDISAATNHFSEAIKIDSGDKEAASLKLVARCRLAQANSLSNKGQNSISEIQKIIKEQSSEDKVLFSNAYNALGHCQKKAGNNKEAVLAFLHTQLLYPNQADAQAEALHELYQLWNSLNYTDRAREAQNLLRRSYRNTYYGNPDITRK